MIYEIARRSGIFNLFMEGKLCNSIKKEMDCKAGYTPLKDSTITTRKNI